MMGVVGENPLEGLPERGLQGIFLWKCSGPGGTGLAVAVLGGTGGHSPPSGLAGEVSVGAPRED